MQHKSDYESFCKNTLLEGLGSKELKDLYDLTLPITLEPGEILFYEGDMAKDLFFITQGTLEITKHDPEITDVHLVDTVSEGNIIGEQTFIDEGARSASIRAKTKATLRRISFHALENQINRLPKYNPVYIQLAKNISLRLRNSSEHALTTMKREAKQVKLRVQTGNFLIYLMISLSVYNYGLDGLQYLIRIAPNTSYVALPFTLILAVSFSTVIIASKISWKSFGIRFTHSKQATYEGILFSLPLMALCLFAKWLMIRFDADYKDEPLFDPFAVILDPEHKNWPFWVGLNSLYWFIIVPIQELFTRGLLQGMFEIFLSGKHKIVNSILMSNMIFSVAHLFFSLEIAIVTFIGGLYMGWIYSRSHNLISSIIAHALLGTWFLSIVGTPIT